MFLPFITTLLILTALVYLPWYSSTAMAIVNSIKDKRSLAHSIFSYVWVQLGGNIDGEFANDASGIVSVSADGNTIAVGAMNNDGNGDDSGHVRIYMRQGTSWIQKGQDINGEAAGDLSGGSISLSSDGNAVAIGAFGNDYYDGPYGFWYGHVRIFTWNGNSWTQRGQDIDGEDYFDFSGSSVSLSGDGGTVAVGSPYSLGDNNYGGVVRIFRWSSGIWEQKGQDIDGEAKGDVSGWSVSISDDGDTVAVGAPDNDDTGNYAGQVRVYGWNGNKWAQRGQDLDGEGTGDYSGSSVALSSDGNTVAMGAYGNNAGYVRVFQWGDGDWVQKGQDIDGEAVGDWSGWAVSLGNNGNVVAIGANRNDDTGTNAGQVRVYEYSGTAWVKRGQDIDGEGAGGEAGSSVALSGDGYTVVVGAPGNDGGGSNAGTVKVFAWDGPSVQVVESDHPYETGTKRKWKINLDQHFDGCAVLNMDPLSSTASSKDFVKLRLKTAGSSANVGDSKLYKDKLSDFPSTTVHGEKLKIKFKTKSSDSDYGFKLYIAPCPEEE